MAEIVLDVPTDEVSTDSYIQAVNKLLSDYLKRIEDLESEINSLDGRVTALEP